MQAVAVPTVTTVVTASAWNHSLLACFSDCNSCIAGYCCPCCVYGAAADMLMSGTKKGGA